MDDVQLSKLYSCTLSTVQRVYSKTLCATRFVCDACFVDRLSYLPASDAQQEAEYVRLLLFLKLFDVCDNS